MTDRFHESMSAIMDGEADELELRRVLNEVIDNPELRGKWERYHMIRSHLHGDALLVPSSDRKKSIRAGINEDVAAESSQSPELDVIISGDSSAYTTQPGKWKGRLTAVAVAASVAVAVVLGFSLQHQLPGQALPRVAEAQVAPSQQPALNRTVNFAAAPSKRDIERARAYMLHHTQQSAMSNPPGAIPFVKMAVYRTQ